MKSVDVIMLPVKDRQKAKEFYLRLGFQIMAEVPMPNDETWVQMGLPNCNTSLSLASFHAVVCDINDMESEIEKLNANGIEVGKVENTPWGKFAWLKDLDGNKVCLHQK